MGIGATLQRLGEVDFGLRLGAVEDGEDMTGILGLELPKGFRCRVFGRKVLSFQREGFRTFLFRF